MYISVYQNKYQIYFQPLDKLIWGIRIYSVDVIVTWAHTAMETLMPRLSFHCLINYGWLYWNIWLPSVPKDFFVFCCYLVKSATCSAHKEVKTHSNNRDYTTCSPDLHPPDLVPAFLNPPQQLFVCHIDAPIISSYLPF